MPKAKTQSAARGPAAQSGGKARTAARLVRRTTQGALIAVSLTVAQLRWEENVLGDMFFDRHLVDRLQAPITRFHE